MLGWWVTGRAFHREASDGTVALSRTGANLNECLSVLGVTLTDVCFVEAVRCRPESPGPWHPSDRVRQRCRRFLAEELPILRPRLVLPLGTTATLSCLEVAHARRGGALGDVAGTAIAWAAPWGPCWIVPLYHPSPANNGRWPENRRFLRGFVDDHPEVLGPRSS